MTKTLPGLIILFFAVTASFGATVYLDSGDEITGMILKENDNYVVIRSENQDIEINKEFVTRIDRDKGETAAGVDRSTGTLEFPGYTEKIQTHQDISLKTGVDFSGQHVASSDSDSAALGVKNGVSVAAEYTKFMDPVNMGFAESIGLTGFGLGVGIAYEIPRKLDNLTGQISFLPVYALFKFRTTPNKNNEFAYLTGQIGYNLFFGDNLYTGSSTLIGGFYYAAGCGYDFRVLNFTLLYSIDRGALSSQGTAVSIDYSKISLMAGVKIP